MNGAERISQMIKSTHRRLNWLAYVSAFGGLAFILGLWLILSFTGALEAVSPKLRAAATLTTILICIGLAIRGIRNFSKPTQQDAFAEIDALSETRPASTLIDNPVRPHAQAAAMWAEHREKVLAEARNLPQPSLWKKAQAIDPLFFRFITPIALIASIVFAGNLAIPRLQNTFKADFGTLVGADNLIAQAWVTPPAYTGHAPFDVSANQTFSAPAGSEFTIRVETHGKPKLKLHYGKKTKSLPLKRGADGTYETKLKLDLQKEVTAEIHWWGKRAAYDISTNADQFPTITFDGYPKIDDNDRTAFGWSAQDDYGITDVSLIIRPAKPKAGEENFTDTIKLDLPGIEPQKAKNKAALNLTRHKWAGIPIIAFLRVSDAAGQKSDSREVAFTLPQKLFLQPMARAAMEVRSVVLREWQDYDEAPTANAEIMDNGQISPIPPSKLEKAPKEIKRAAIMLDSLTYKPDTYFNDRVIYLGLRQAKHIIASAESKPEADTSEGILWSVAMRAEYGTLADAARALEAARKALETALRDGASEEDIKRLMKAYKQAVQNYVDMRLAEALRRGIDPADLDGEAPNSMKLGGSDLEKMLKTLEELTETGATEQARQLLSDMSDLLEAMKNLQLSNSMSGDPLGSQQNPTSKELEKLAEELRDQRDLNDDTLQKQREQQNATPGESGQPSAPNGSGPSLEQRQKELAERHLNSPSLSNENGTGSENGSQSFGSNGEIEGMTGDYPMDEDGYRLTPKGDAVTAAKEAQRKAAQALSEGDLETAMRHQKDAEKALTRAATEMAAEADKARGEQGNGTDLNEAQDASDPLGRPTGNGLIGDGDEIKVPETMDRQRAYEILEELRERSSKQGLSDDEMDYLLRLLKRF